jgi:hypothetical protein
MVASRGKTIKLYKEEDEFISWIVLIVFALMFLAVCLMAGLYHPEQRPAPNDLRSAQWREFNLNI